MFNSQNINQTQFKNQTMSLLTAGTDFKKVII